MFRGTKGLWRSAYLTEFHQTHEVLNFHPIIFKKTTYKNLRKFHLYHFPEIVVFLEIIDFEICLLLLSERSIVVMSFVQSYILKNFCFQAKVKWLYYNSKHAAGVVKASPIFHDFPQKWPIWKNEMPIPSYSCSVELTLSLDIPGYMKEKRVRNDKVHYTLAHAKGGVPHIVDIEEGFVMKNDAFCKEMLISPVVIPIEENRFFRRTTGKSGFGPHQILPVSMRIVTKGSISVQKSEIQRTRGYRVLG